MLNFNILASGSLGPSPPWSPPSAAQIHRGFPHVGEHWVHGCKIRPFLMGDFLPFCLIFSSIPAMGERPLTLSDIFMGDGSAWGCGDRGNRRHGPAPMEPLRLPAPMPAGSEPVYTSARRVLRVERNRCPAAVQWQRRPEGRTVKAARARESERGSLRRRHAAGRRTALLPPATSAAKQTESATPGF